MVNDREDSLGFMMGRVGRMHHQRSHEFLGELGLYPGQPPIMFMLWEKDGLSQKEISEKLRLRPATITIMLKRMEKAGFLERRKDAEDGRVSRVYLTERGKQIKKRAEEVHRQVDEQCLIGFSTEEISLFKSFLNRMGDNLKE